MGDIDLAAVDHAQKRDRTAVLAQDHGPGEVELELGLGHYFSQLLGRERVERGALGEKARDLAQSRVLHDLLSPDIGHESTVTGPTRCGTRRPGQAAAPAVPLRCGCGRRACDTPRWCAP